MHDEDENVAGDDAFEMSADAGLDADESLGLDEEDSYDPDDRYH